jgi:hypothetical protein
MRDTSKRRKLPRTHDELRRLLSDAAVAGYLAGMKDKANGDAPSRAVAAARRRQMRAEIARWVQF